MATVTTDTDFVSVRGPIEAADGAFVLRIPLALGGAALAKYAGSVGRIDGDVLRLEFSPRLMRELEWKEGDIVSVDNLDGLLNVEPWDGSE